MVVGQLRYRLDVSQAGRRARARVLGAFAPVLQASLAAVAAWLVAHRLLGHPQPFFAPIAAAISLSTSHVQRSRRIAQMVAGVLMGIAVAELLRPVLGSSAGALGLTVLVTMVIALAIGVGFFGDGMMFPNQAAVSAVLVVTLHKHGTGAERAVDVLVGGAVALVVGVGLFPADPRALLADSEQDLLATLARRLATVSDQLAAGTTPDDDWILAAGHEIHRALAAMARTRQTARVNVRVAPRRFGLRPAVDAEIRRTARLDLLANAVLSLLRAATLRRDGQTIPPPALQDQIGALGSAIARLTDAPRPWPAELLLQLEASAAEIVDDVTRRPIDHGLVVASILRATARDLLDVIEVVPVNRAAHR